MCEHQGSRPLSSGCWKLRLALISNIKEATRQQGLSLELLPHAQEAALAQFPRGSRHCSNSYAWELTVWVDNAKQCSTEGFGTGGLRLHHGNQPPHSENSLRELRGDQLPQERKNGMFKVATAQNFAQQISNIEILYPILYRSISFGE